MSTCANNTILVVEDNDGIREGLTALLALDGYKVEEASNGQEALDKLKTTDKPCLILLDLMMPVMDGWKFSALKEQDISLAAIPMVIVTAATNLAPPRNSLCVLQKPLDLRLLREIVREFCRMRHGQQQDSGQQNKGGQPESSPPAH